MRIQSSGDRSNCSSAVISLGSDGTLDALGAELDEQWGGWLTQLIEREQLDGKLESTALIPTPDVGQFDSVLIVGIGEGEGLHCGNAFRIGATTVRQLSKRNREGVLIAFASQWTTEMCRALVAGLSSGVQGQDLYREHELSEPEVIQLVGVEQSTIDAGVALASGIDLTKQLVNEPPNIMYPESFVAIAEQWSSRCGFSVESWDAVKLKEENCNAILAVGSGATNQPRLAIFRYNGGPSDEAPIAIVGKGVTFDSGGLSIKPSEGMKDMKCDMAGAATVLGTMVAASQLSIPKNIVGLVGLAENMISGDSYRLGDVIQSRNGKTIEVLNTDAEGRIVLADTLDVAIEQEPSNIIDLATLTGACLVALGMDVTGVMTNNDAWRSEFFKAAEHEDELVWELPMFDFYGDQIKSKVADIKNVGEGRWGGAITAGKFLEEFVGDIPWIHLDIAGPAFADSAKPWRDAGATGAMVRTLIRLLETC